MWQTTKDLQIQYFVPLWINYVWDASTPKCCQWQQWEKNNNMSVKVAGTSVLVRGNVLLVRGPVLKSSSSSLCFAAVYKLSGCGLQCCLGISVCWVMNSGFTDGWVPQQHFKKCSDSFLFFNLMSVFDKKLTHILQVQYLHVTKPYFL